MAECDGATERGGDHGRGDMFRRARAATCSTWRRTKVLTATLRRLERFGLIDREMFAEVPTTSRESLRTS